MMINKRRVFLTHFDLDGIGCDILLTSMFAIEKKLHFGYENIHKTIENKTLSGYDSVLVTDVSLTQNQFTTLYSEYGDRMLYVDHHKPSIALVNNYNFSTKRPMCLVDMSLSATGLLALNMSKYIQYQKPELLELAKYIDSYDMWRHKTNPDTFRVGYSLNTLFWNYGWFKFFDRFKRGFSGFTQDELEVIKTTDKHRKTQMDSTERIDFSNGSILFVGVNKSFVNDYALEYPGYEFYYMVYSTGDNGVLRLSIRTDRPKVDIGGTLIKIKSNFPIIFTAGGHEQAAGVDFNRGVQFNDIIPLLEVLDEDLRSQL